MDSVTIPSNMAIIEGSVFQGCSKLTSVTIPESVTMIEENAFKGCSSLPSVTIPNSVVSIGKYAFTLCSSLSSVTIGNSVTSIGDAAFKGCSSLASVTIPNSVGSIGKSAFRDCSRMTSVTIGNSVTSIGDAAFKGCSSLASVTINSNAILSKNYSSTSSLKDIFDNYVKKYTIGDGVTAIGQYAFYQCTSMESVTIGKDVKSIRECAFYRCSSLADIYFDGTETQWGKVTKGQYWKQDVASTCKEHWRCTVTFNANGHGTAPSAQTNLWSNESTATEPNAPTASGYVFTGWYTDAACTTKWEFNTPVPRDMTLYAGWDTSLQLADNSTNNLTSYNGQKLSVTLKDRTLYTDGEWSTLCLPFAVSNLTGTPLEGFTVKELDTVTGYGGHVTGFDGTTLYLNFKDATSIEAGKPYLVKKEDMTATSATPTYSPIEGTSGSNWNQGYANLIDGSTGGNMWRTSISEGHTPYCEFHTDQPFIVSGYKLTTGNQNAIGDPTVWSLKAKLNADDEWTVIDSRNVSANASDALPSSRTKEKSYTVQHPGTYQYFHFEVSQTGGNYMCLSELALQCYNLEPVNVENPMFTSVTINNAAPTAVTSSDGTVSFMGGYSPVSLAANDSTNLYLGNGNTLCYPNANLTIGSCRAYLLTNTSMGDVNGDGAINITDVIFMVNHILGQNNDDFIIANADINQSGGIDISDVVLLVNKILSPESSVKVTNVVSNVDITYDSSGSGSAR